MRPVVGNQMPIGGFPIGGFPRIGGPAIQPPSNNTNGLATTVNSLPPQIESLSSALQNINELANQLTGGIGALMGSLQGNENAPGLGITDMMDRRPTMNGFGPQPMMTRGTLSGIGALHQGQLGQNPLQLGRLV
jgi:hypothetical protein